MTVCFHPSKHADYLLQLFTDLKKKSANTHCWTDEGSVMTLSQEKQNKMNVRPSLYSDEHNVNQHK